jgi:hypothetical protein
LTPTPKIPLDTTIVWPSTFLVLCAWWGRNKSQLHQRPKGRRFLYPDDGCLFVRLRHREFVG